MNNLSLERQRYWKGLIIIEIRKPPLALVCFDRPEYTEQCAKALANSDSVHEREIAVFIDGAPPPQWESNNAGYQRSETRSIQQRIDIVSQIIREYLPDAFQFPAPVNLGIALNVRRALGWSFSEKSTTFAYLLEDDVVVSPSWFRVMDMVTDFADSHADIGFFTAHGRERLTQDEQGPFPEQLSYGSAMLRATGQSREHFLKVDAILTPFYQALTGIDYRDKARSRAIMRFKPVFEVLGGRPGALGQDGLRQWASFNLGYVPVRTHGSWTRYIGIEGIYATAKFYASKDFSRSYLQVDTPKALKLPDEETRDECRRQMNRRFTAALAEDNSKSDRFTKRVLQRLNQRVKKMFKILSFQSH